jgi:hypothetical protein
MIRFESRVRGGPQYNKPPKNFLALNKSSVKVKSKLEAEKRKQQNEITEQGRRKKHVTIHIIYNSIPLIFKASK